MSLSPEQQERYISIWAKAVDTQMHFNEMSVKSRQLGLTFVAAALGVGVVLLGRGNDFAIPIKIGKLDFQVHIAVILILGAWLALSAVKELDLSVYHKMLRGAVAFGEDFEENYMKQIFDLNKGMTQAITFFSRHDDAKTRSIASGKYEYDGTSEETALNKIKKFYRRTTCFLLVGAAIIFLGTNIAHWSAGNADNSHPSIEQPQSKAAK